MISVWTIEKKINRVIRALKKNKNLLCIGSNISRIPCKDNKLIGYEASMVFYAGKLVDTGYKEVIIKGKRNNFKYSLHYGTDISDIEAKILSLKIENALMLNVGY